MASIHQDPQSKNYRVMFRYGGKQFQKSLKTKDGAEAERLKGRIETTLLELERGRRALPPDADLWEFLISDGQRAKKAVAQTVLTLEQLFDRYVGEMPPGTMEQNSLDTVRGHWKNLLRILGPRTAVQAVTTTLLQRYVNQRTGETHRGKNIQPPTIKKEVGSLRAAMNWGKIHGIVTGDPPTKGLRYEKGSAKSGFMTWTEIEQRIARGGLSEDEVEELWDGLFLDTEQIAACLEHVRTVPLLPPFVYPMFVFVAHTGARRSEIIRSRVEDVDFGNKRVRIREKKRDTSKKETERFVRLSSRLGRAMRDWYDAGHPGGPFTFCQEGVIPRSRTRSRTTGHQSGAGRATTTAGRNATVQTRADVPGVAALTDDVATYYFNKALVGSKWEVVRGFHVFRHSFASNMARAGIPRDVVDEYMGHQTEEMRKRYRHMFPEEGVDAMRKVFGDD